MGKDTWEKNVVQVRGFLYQYLSADNPSWWQQHQCTTIQMWQEVKGKWKLSPAELLVHRRGFSPSNWLSLSLNAAIKVEEWYQSLKRAKYVEHCGLGKLKHGHHQWTVHRLRKWCRQHCIQICQSRGFALQAVIWWGIFAPHEGSWIRCFPFIFPWILKGLSDIALLYICSVNSNQSSKAFCLPAE